MVDTSFFDGVTQFPISHPKYSLCHPVFYNEMSALQAVFITPLARVRGWLPSSQLHPIRVTPWHTLTGITAFEYRQTDIGPYNEVAIAFPVSIGKRAPVLLGLLGQLSHGLTTYVWHLPVTTAIARDLGIEVANYPKFLATIEFRRDRGWMHCRLAADGQEILQLSGRELTGKPGGHTRLSAINVRDDRLLRCEMNANHRRHAVSRRAADVRLQLGDHPIAADLRSLRIGRLLQYEFLPSSQAILTGVIESYPAA
jgi:hypothetical protein